MVMQREIVNGDSEREMYGNGGDWKTNIFVCL